MAVSDYPAVYDDHVRQFVQEVVDFSSQYGSDTSMSYTMSNLAGQCNIFPNYGDFTQSAVLRTYGPWWSMAPSAPRRLKRSAHTFISEDFIDLSFKEKVYPEHITVYETYNPGAVVRILACNTSSTLGSHQKNHTVRWFVLWSGLPQQASAQVRSFCPTPIASCPFPTNLIRLELNQVLVDYYTELDAVWLDGRKSSSVDALDTILVLHPSVLPQNQYSDTTKTNYIENKKSAAVIVTSELASLHMQDGLSAALDVSDNGYFDCLPSEVIQLLLSYLDFTTLGRLARSCRLLYKHCYDTHQYTTLNAQPYWNKISDASLDGLRTRCTHLQHLSLSWCGSYDLLTSSGMYRFLKVCSANLVCLRLASCRFVDGSVIAQISSECANLEELDIQCCRKIQSSSFACISRLVHLRTLNLYRTMIDTASLFAVIKACHILEHLNLGACTAIGNYDDVITRLGMNCRNLKSLDLWRAKGLTEIGLRCLATNCPFLQELDLGWCSDLKSSTSCFIDLARQCSDLRKLFLTANRTVCDLDLEAIAKYCTALQQLDILGTREVRKPAIEQVLTKCSKLRFFDLSFCEAADFESVAQWTIKYPHVSIKKSFQADNNLSYL